MMNVHFQEPRDSSYKQRFALDHRSARTLCGRRGHLT